jgi:hypothetical protein
LLSRTVLEETIFVSVNQTAKDMTFYQEGQSIIWSLYLTTFQADNKLEQYFAKL